MSVHNYCGVATGSCWFLSRAISTVLYGPIIIYIAPSLTLPSPLFPDAANDAAARNLYLTTHEQQQSRALPSQKWPEGNVTTWLGASQRSSPPCRTSARCARRETVHIREEEHIAIECNLGCGLIVVEKLAEKHQALSNDMCHVLLSIMIEEALAWEGLPTVAATRSRRCWEPLNLKRSKLKECAWWSATATTRCMLRTPNYLLDATEGEVAIEEKLPFCQV